MTRAFLGQIVLGRIYLNWLDCDLYGKRLRKAYRRACMKLKCASVPKSLTILIRAQIIKVCSEVKKKSIDPKKFWSTNVHPI